MQQETAGGSSSEKGTLRKWLSQHLLHGVVYVAAMVLLCGVQASEENNSRRRLVNFYLNHLRHRLVCVVLGSV